MRAPPWAERLSGGHPLLVAQRGYVLALSGRRDEAGAVIRTLEEQRSTRYFSPAYVAAIYTALGDADAAMKWLEHAFDAHDDWIIYLPVEPAFEPLRSDPRFVSLLRRIRANR